MLHCTCRAGRPAFWSYHVVGAWVVAYPACGNCPTSKLGNGSGANGTPVASVITGCPNEGASTAAGIESPPAVDPFESPVAAYTTPQPPRNTVFGVIW